MLNRKINYKWSISKAILIPEGAPWPAGAIQHDAIPELSPSDPKSRRRKFPAPWTASDRNRATVDAVDGLLKVIQQCNILYTLWLCLAIENGHRNDVSFPLKNDDFPSFFKRLPGNGDPFRSLASQRLGPSRFRLQHREANRSKAVCPLNLGRGEVGTWGFSLVSSWSWLTGKSLF